MVHADKKLTAFVELESACGFAANRLDELARFLPNSASLNGSESGGDICPAGFFVLFRTRDPKINSAGS